MSKSLFLSLNQTIGIREFINDYLEADYTEKGYLTHYMMEKYLLENGYPTPTRVCFDDIKEEDINSGRVVAVREETKNKKKGKILVYENPLDLKDSRLLLELKEDCDEEELLERRRKIMIEDYNMFLNLDGKSYEIKNYEDREPKVTLENDLEEEYSVNDSVNRQKVYVRVGRRRIMERRRY